MSVEAETPTFLRLGTDPDDLTVRLASVNTFHWRDGRLYLMVETDVVGIDDPGRVRLLMLETALGLRS